MIRLIKAYFKQRRYDKYMKSKEWARIRRLALLRDNHKCFLCETSKNLEVHHLSYEDDIYKTKLYSVVTLCRQHHAKIHKKINYNS